MSKLKKFHSDVDYSLLSKEELKYKTCIDMFTIFYLSKNIGLTDLEIHAKALELKLTGYNGMTPDCITRSNIYKWNSIADSIVGKICLKVECNKFANHGTQWNNPIYCKKHSEQGMSLVIEQRLYRQNKSHVHRKGKFYLDKKFLERILKINNFIDNVGAALTTPLPCQAPILIPTLDVNVQDLGIIDFDNMRMFDLDTNYIINL